MTAYIFGVQVLASTATPTLPLTEGFHLETPEQLTFNFPASRALAEGTTVQLFYKLPISGTWLEAHPLLYVRATDVTSGAPEAVVNACKGTIFDLVPGQTYDWRVTGTEPGIGTWELTGQRATRPLPAVAGAPTVTATPGSNLDALVAGLTPGSVLQLADGTYTLTSPLTINCQGTDAQPIYIRGQSKTGVVLSRSTGVAVYFVLGSNVVLENLSIQGSGVDSGTASSSVGVEFWAGGSAQRRNTIRDIRMSGVDKGVSTINAQQTLVYNVEATGNNTWDKAYIINPASGVSNYTWNDDGLLLAGEGNCAWNCTLTGFGDATASGHSTGGGRANYFYRLDIPMTGDDVHEFDYTDGPCAFYDSRVGNCGSFYSAQPVWGGPAFAFRNAVANSIRGPLKLNDVNSGMLVYNNTVFRTPGSHGFGLYQSGQGGSYFQRSLSHRNNLYIIRGTPTEVVRFDSLCDRLDWTNNGYFPDGSFDWAASGGGVTASLAAARAALPSRLTLFGAGQRHVNDVIVSSSNPWVQTLTLGADHTTQFTASPDYVLAAGSNALNAGVAIPGITTGFSGAAPSMGAVIPGRSLVQYGANIPSSSWSVPAAGASVQIGYTSGAHPQGLPSTLYDIDPVLQSWGTGTPWAGSGSRGFKPWHSHNVFGGIVWVQSTEQAVMNGGGHVAYCATAPQAWDVISLSCKWLAIPVPSDGFSQVGAITNVSELGTTYPSAQLDADWGEWKGDYVGISAGLRQPGKVFPEVSHSYYGQFWVPGEYHGNSRGAIVMCAGITGNGENSGIKSGHYFDLDTATYLRTSNRRTGNSAAAGATIFHTGVGKGFAVTSGPTANVFSYDVYDPTSRSWTQRTATNETVAIIEAGGLGAYVSASVPQGLLLNFIPVNAGGTIAYNLATKHRIDAMSAAAAVSGGGTWSTLTVTGASWPTLPGSVAGDISAGDTAAAIGWCFCPPKNAFYAVNGRHGSTTLWKLSPPAGANTLALLLSGTWTVTTETFTGGLVSHKADGSGVGGRFVYNRLIWNSARGCLMFFPESLADKPTAITPT